MVEDAVKSPYCRALRDCSGKNICDVVVRVVSNPPSGGDDPISGVPFNPRKDKAACATKRARKAINREKR